MRLPNICVHRAGRRLALCVVIAWLSLTGCVEESRYCQSADECESGRCVLGRCADPAPVDAATVDVDTPDVDTEDAGLLDAAADASNVGTADTGPLDAAPTVDASDACDDGPTFERCGPERIRRVDCVDGRVQRGPCAWVPEDPCGEVCRGEGCNASLPPGVGRRTAFGEPSSIPGLALFLPRAAGALRCSGYAAGYSGDIDFVCETAFDLDGLPTRTDCLYCDRNEQRTTLYTREDGGLTLETRCLPSQRQVETARIVLRADGQVDRVEITNAESGYTLHGRYSAGGLLEQIERVDGAGATVERRVMQRAEDGRLVGERSTNPYGEYTVGYGYGCRACAGADCVEVIPAGCTPMPGAIPPVYYCDLPAPEECPDGLLPGWFEDANEAVWLSTHMLDEADPAPAPRWVGARFDGETWRWTATGQPITVPLSGGIDAGGGERGSCARLAILGGTRRELDVSGHVDRWRAELEPIRCVALDGRRGWCRADPAAMENLPGAD